MDRLRGWVNGFGGPTRVDAAARLDALGFATGERCSVGCGFASRDASKLVQHRHGCQWHRMVAWEQARLEAEEAGYRE